MAIQTRVETQGKEPAYARRRVGEREVASRRYRQMVGGMWDEMASLQLDFLRGRGLRPEHRFIDVGCGSLRAGRLLVPYLDPGHYYGIDVNRELIQAGYDHELDAEDRARLPESNLRVTDRFDVDFGVDAGVRFHAGIAQSIFSHLSLNHLRLCLWRVSRALEVGGRFYVTYFEQPDDFPVDGVPEERALYTERNRYWYYRDDLVWAARGVPLEARHIGDWGHPRGQVMMEYVRTPG